jgi:hypothetical protein
LISHGELDRIIDVVSFVVRSLAFAGQEIFNCYPRHGNDWQLERGALDAQQRNRSAYASRKTWLIVMLDRRGI